MVTVYFLCVAFSSASQLRSLQIWLNHFLHHFKVSALFLVALLSLDQDMPSCKHSQKQPVVITRKTNSVMKNVGV